MISRKKSLLLPVAILAIVILSGLVMTTQLVDHGRQEFRLDLLRHARISASSFSPQQVTNLVNSSKQNRQTGCEPVWERLQKIQQAIPQMRYIYLMHLVDGQVRFLADSDDPPCSDYSAENGIYTEASAELKNIFATAQPFVEGPLADQWGSWVSGVAPIIDRHTGEVVAVVGLDIDTASYYSKLLIYRGFGITVTVLTALLVILLLAILWRGRNARDRLADLNRSLNCEIVERQRAQSCLQQQLNFLQVLIDAIAYPVFYRDACGKYLGCNRAFATLVGKTKAELIGKSVHDHFPPEYADVYAQADRDLLAQGLGGIQTYEFNIPSVEGKALEVIFSKATFPTVNGKLGGVIGTIVDISERKEVEKALRKSENLFRSIFANTAAGVITVTFKGEFLKTNPAFCQMLGYSETELGQMSQHDITHPDDLESTARIYRDVVRHKPERFEIVKRYRCKDGTIVWVQITGSWVYDGENPIHAVLLVLDISERKRVHDELCVQKELLDNIIDHVPASIFWKDRQLVFLGCNQALANQAGFDRPAEMIGKTDYDLPWKKEEADFFRACDRQVMASAQPMLDIEETQQQAGGRQATLLTSKVPLTNRAGDVVGLLGIFTDITERKQAEKTLKKSEQDYRLLYKQFRGLLNAMPDTIMLISADLTIVWANQGARSQFTDYGNLHNQYCFNALDGRNQPCASCPVQRCFESGKHEEQLVYGGDGRVWAVRAYPLKDEHGKVVNVIDVCSDITEKIKLRTEADRNSRLASLGELAAGVAHEINNPNGLILLNTPMLRDVLNDALCLFEDHYQQHGRLELGGLDYHELRDELPAMLQRIEGGAVRIKRIVEDLKNFVSQGEVDLSDPLDLNEVAKTAIRLVDNSIKKTTDHFETDFGTLPPGQGDFQWIEQVVINLVQNACLALTDRSARVRLATYFDAENKCNILQVQDEGAGIAPEALAHVTDPFYTTRRQSGGTGLGLSVSARIIREHNGQLDFQSILGVGTVVTMKLPIAEQGEPA